MVTREEWNRKRLEETEKEIAALEKNRSGKAPSDDETEEVDEESADEEPNTSSVDDDNDSYDDDDVLFSESSSTNEEEEEGKEEPQKEEQTKKEQKHDWEKRYKDLQRYLTEVKKELKELKEKSSSPKLPTDPAKVQEWVEKNPQAAAIVRAFVQQETSAVAEKVSKIDTRMTREEAKRMLTRYHPDFEEIRVDPNFKKWVEKQPQMVKDILFTKTNFDVDKIAWVLDNFKTYRKASSSDTEMSKRAASDVKTKSGGGREFKVNKGGYDFSESQIEAMSMKDFEANWEKIQKARQEGRIFYDLTQKRA